MMPMTMIDALEPRRMLAADTTLLRVKSVTADNRGEILVQFSERATGVKGSAFQVYTAGADGKLYTSDDKRETVGFTYSKAKKLLRIVANIPKDTPYRLKLDGKTRIKSEANGSLLDGDFVSASRASGDGVAGGNYEMQVQRDTGKSPEVKIRTSVGDITVRMRGDLEGLERTISNFLTYVNKGRYDGVIFHRIVTTNSGGIGIVQAGGFTGTGQTLATDPGSGEQYAKPTQAITNEAPIKLEAGILSNLAGTLAMARTGDPDSATGQFYFNVTNNIALDPNSSSDGYAAFAEVTNAASTATLAAIYGATISNLSNGMPYSTFTTVPTVNSSIISVQRAAVFSKVVSKKG
ncbi:hypothetical protein EON77_02410 [bacterium]|nr:MAG: hypothetical protein EON77_02410 [bacterium]